MHFEKVTPESYEIAVEMFRSNAPYNQLERGKEVLTFEEVKEELEYPNSESLYVKLDDTYIGLINYMKKAPTDGQPWLGLLLIHGDYQWYGFGTNAYLHFQEQMKAEGVETLHLGVLETNTRARSFWEGFGFQWIRKGTTGNGLAVDVLGKSL